VGGLVRTLAIETATVACAVGLDLDGEVRVRLLDEARRHTETLVPGIEALLAEAYVVPRDLERVVVDVGPGLFTGLRVGVATALAFAQALGCDLVGVTSLECLAEGARRAGVRGRLSAVVDARRGEVFVQEFELSDDAATARGAATLARPRDEVIRVATNGAPITFTGDGVERHRADYATVPGATILEARVPSLEAALALGGAREPVGTLAPLYLRDADAVANFATRDTRP
jgi:tRNA threonylcarbamoyl adenosine modification protein YeaZ